MLNLFKKEKEPEKYDYVIAGLGNPGEKYAKTRHNIGWMAVTALAIKNKLTFKPGKGKYYYANLSYAGKMTMLLLPTTYMNNSGEALKFIQNRYKVESKNFLIVVDEYNFPLGKVHLKNQGSGGGHNGTSSVLNHLGEEFGRLRLGIEKNFGAGELVNYVLSNFNEDEVDKVNLTLDKAVLSMEHILKAGFQRATSDINSGKLFSDNNYH